MGIYALQHVSVIVADTQRAVSFYHGVLGLALSDQRPDLGYPGAWLDINNQQQIHLLELPNPDAGLERPEHGGRDRHLALECDSLAEVISALDQARLPYTLSRSGRQALFCCDPDDNAIEIMQRS